jgi:aryl carrier-like protein
MVLNADWRRIPAVPFLSELQHEEAPAATHESATTDTVLLDLLLANPEERSTKLEEWLRQTVAKVLRSEPTRIHMRKPLTALGMDSIMAVELRNRITRTLQLNVTLVELFTGSIAKLVEKLEHQLSTDERLIQMVEEIAKLSTEEVKSQLVGDNA